ncbi:MAG TPA: outer membrane beta-barrel protein [Vicinamibacterales bacterium]|nr:outer membrane beta-barrel protein [Vicinamibacterales bacterium]
MKNLSQSVILAAFAALVASTPAAAQTSDERVTVTFTAAAASLAGDSDLALAGTAGYRFTDHLSFEGDFTWIDGSDGGGRYPVFALGDSRRTTVGVNDLLSRTTGIFTSLDLRLPTLPSIPIPVEGFDVSSEGETLIGTLGVRYEPAVQTARFRPYVSGGLGINRTTQEFEVSIGTAIRDVEESISDSGFALSAGGGASIRLFSSVWVNADAKYFRLSRDRNVIRFGGGLGLRF